MGAPKDLNLIYVVERDIFYKTVSQFLDNLFLKKFMVRVFEGSYLRWIFKIQDSFCS
jgi:hypothetical protein